MDWSGIDALTPFIKQVEIACKNKTHRPGADPLQKALDTLRESLGRTDGSLEGNMDVKLTRKYRLFSSRTPELVGLDATVAGFTGI